MIQIVFTSPADILPDEAKKLNAIVLPVDVIFGTDVYKDGVDLNKAEFFAKMEEFVDRTGKLPHTSQINTEEHIETFKPLLDQGDEIFYVSMSSGTSLTIERARDAVKELNAEDRITIFDSETITVPYGMIVKEIIKARDKGMTRAEILEVAKDVTDRIELLCVVNEITYLKKGGRLKGAQAVVATALSIKPLITIRDTKVDSFGKAIGFAGACKKMAKMYSEYEVDKDMPIYTAHSNAPELMDKLIKQIKAVTPGFNPVDGGGIGCAVGTHIGPGCCGVAFFRKKGSKSLLKNKS